MDSGHTFYRPSIAPVISRSMALGAGLALAVASAPGRANDAEREALARLAHELAALTALIDDAEQRANRAARVRFRYDWLRQDLARVRTGILEQVATERAEPRSVAPLKGDYRR